jgi:hypothetical protein
VKGVRVLVYVNDKRKCDERRGGEGGGVVGGGEEKSKRRRNLNSPDRTRKRV